MKQSVFLVPLVVLTACASPSLQEQFTPQAVPDAAPEATAAPTVTAPPPRPTARTVEEFDTTTSADREQALATPVSASGPLGTTLATLGSPTDPGIWVKTPYVSDITQGRVEYEGRSINVELRPSGGAPGSGSQISLPAMRLLNAPLTGIIELTVFDA